MTSEVCPHCGRTFKRLKSHLPHCKAAPASTPASPRRDATADQTPPQLAAAKGRKAARATSPNAVESKAASADASSSPPHPASSAKRRQKPSDQIKMADALAPGPPPAPSKPKKKSLRALIEAAKVTPGSTAQDLPPGAMPQSPGPGPKSPRATAARSGSKARPTLVAADTNAKRAPRALAKTESASFSSLDLSGCSDRPGAGGSSCVGDGEEGGRPSVGEASWKSGSGSQARVTLQDVKTTLARGKTSGSSILERIAVSDLSVKTETRASLSPGSGSPGSSTEPASAPLPAAGPRWAEGAAAERGGPVQTCLIPPKDGGSAQRRLTAAAAPPPSDRPPSQARLTTPPQHTAAASHRGTSPPSAAPALGYASRPRPSLPAGSDWSAAQENAAGAAAAGGRGLGQARLRELPGWLAGNAPRYPGEALEMIQRGWQWYYRKYIDVRRGGVGGVAMLVAGYCVLSYVWSYPHLKRDRWRKYH